MKVDRILSTAGICQKNSLRIRSYCNLIQASLDDKWLFADEFINSHVCFIRDDYLHTMDNNLLNKAQAIVVVNVSNSFLQDHPYQISTPISSSKIKYILNKISASETFKPLTLTFNENKISNKKTAQIFKNTFTKMRGFFKNRKQTIVTQRETNNKKKFIANLSQKLKNNASIPYKLVLLGSPGAGKTTAIETASAGKALSSEVLATDSVASNKPKTTVGIDYAELEIKGLAQHENINLKLIGTPGQIKFNFVWDMVGKTADGFMILLDMSRPEPLSYLRFFQNFIHQELSQETQIYCALTHCDKFSGHLDSLTECIESEFPKLKAIYQIDARNHKDVATILSDICPQLIEQRIAEKKQSQKNYDSHLSIVNA